MLNKFSKIYLAGHAGLVGSSILRKLKSKGYKNIIFRTRKQLDLKDQKKVLLFLKKHKPDFIFLAAAKVGGIFSNNKYRADYIYENLLIQSNIIHGAYLSGIKKLIFLGSSCVYPRNCKQPIKEEYLLTGDLEKTNDAYAIAKIAGIKMCESYNKQHKTNYKCLMPTNLYGPNDNFDLNTSHVIPGLIVKFYNAIKDKSENIEIWGTGEPKREFLYVDDLSSAVEFLLEKDWEDELLNIGSGDEISIKELSYLLKDITKFDGDVVFDTTKPDGNPRKLLNSGKINSLGWKSSTSLSSGLEKTFEWYKNNN